MKVFYCLLVTASLLLIGSTVIYIEKSTNEPRIKVVYESMADNDDEYANDLEEAIPEDRPIAN